jgi:hypothetical protein
MNTFQIILADSRLSHVLAKIIAPSKDVHILITGTFGHVTWQVGIKVCNGIKVVNHLILK